MKHGKNTGTGSRKRARVAKERVSSARKAKAKAEPCTHPITRRIGKACALCGQHVG